MLDALLTADALVASLTLTAMEIVLGIDNVVFISILVGRLPAEQQALARRVGPRARARHAHRRCCSRSPGSWG